MAESSVVAGPRRWFSDRLQDLMTGLGGSRDRTTTMSFSSIYLVSPSELEAMYRGDWMARKVVDIVPQDMVRAERHWRASKEQITAIETVENLERVMLWPKLKEALTRARLMGGSLIYIGIRGQDPSTPLVYDSVGRDDLQYITVLDKTSVTPVDLDTDPTSVSYGLPKSWRMQSSTGSRQLDVHPTRMMRFQGMPILSRPVTAADTVFGDSVLQVIYEAIKNAASVQQHVAGLVPDSRNDVIYIPGLGEILQNQQDQADLTRRFNYMAEMRSMYRLLLLEGNGQSGPNGDGEKWEQRTVSFSQLPELMQKYLEIVAGAADIPITRFLGQSPGGLTSTGEADMRNYYDHIGALRLLNLGPQLRKFDEVSIRSALGSRPPEVYYEFGELWALSAKEKAEIFDKKATAARRIVGSGKDIPMSDPRAIGLAMENAIIEDGPLPGLEDAVKQFGSLGDLLGDDELKKTLAPTPPAPKTPAAVPGATPVGDSQPRTLYVRRQLLNTSELLRWASDQGLTGLVPSEELHVTLLSSRAPVDWMQMGSDMFQGDKGKITVPAGGPRAVERFGANSEYVVLLFSSTTMQWRHEQMVQLGASHDFEEYTPHLTLSSVRQQVDISKIVPFRGELRFGPEIFEERDPSV